MLSSQPSSTDSSTSQPDEGLDMLTRLISFQKKLKAWAAKQRKGEFINEAVYQNLLMLCDEAVDTNNISAQYHHILKSCYLMLDSIPKHFTFSANPAHDQFITLILDELSKLAWCENSECQCQITSDTEDNLSTAHDNQDAKVKALLSNLNLHSYIEPRTIKQLTLDHCRVLINKISDAASLLQIKKVTPPIKELTEKLMDKIPSNASIADLPDIYNKIYFAIHDKAPDQKCDGHSVSQELLIVKIYEEILSALLSKTHHHIDALHANASELIYEVLFWDARRFKECSLMKENSEDSTYALVELIKNLLITHTSSKQPENQSWQQIVGWSRDAINPNAQEMVPHKFGAYAAEIENLLPTSGISGDTPAAIKKLLINDFIAFFANPNARNMDIEKALKDLFYDPFYRDGEVREKRKDAYYQLTKLDTFKYDETPKALFDRLEPLVELNTLEDFQLLQFYLAIYPYETAGHGIDIPNSDRLKIILSEIRRYKTQHSDLTSAHFKWFVKHLHDYVYDNGLSKHMLDYILKTAPKSDLSTNHIALEAADKDELESGSNNNNQDRPLSNPRPQNQPAPADSKEEMVAGKQELASGDEKPVNPVAVDPCELLRRSGGSRRPFVDSNPSRDMEAAATMHLARINLRPTWSTMSRTKKVLAVTAVAVVLALALAGLAAILLYAGPVVPIITAAGVAASIQWAAVVGTVGVVSMLAGLPVLGAIVGLFAGLIHTRKSAAAPGPTLLALPPTSFVSASGTNTQPSRRSTRLFGPVASNGERDLKIDTDKQQALGLFPAK